MDIINVRQLYNYSMTNLEIILICCTGIETILTAIWVTKTKKEAKNLLFFACCMAIYYNQKADEYDKLLDKLNIWRSAG